MIGYFELSRSFELFERFCDKITLSRTITAFDNETRQLIKVKYMSMYGRVSSDRKFSSWLQDEIGSYCELSLKSAWKRTSDPSCLASSATPC